MADALVQNMAKLNITYNGEQGDLPDMVPYDASDEEIIRMAAESIADGYVPGIDAVANPDFTNFVVDRFPAKEDVPFNRLSVRPKTEFGMRGYTMIEVMIVLAIAGIVLAGAFGLVGSSCVGHKEAAQDSLAQYTKEMGYEVVNSTCVNKDTDGDGYVSCTAKLKDGKTLNVECVGWQGLTCVKNEGCRAPKMTINGTSVDMGD